MPKLAWHALALLILVCLPVLKFGEAWWRMSTTQLKPAAVLLGAYVAAAAAVLLFVRDEGLRPAARALQLALATLSVFLVLLLFLRNGTPLYLLLPTLAAAVLISLSVLGSAVRLVGLLVLGLGTVVIAVLAGRTIATAGSSEATVAESVIKTVFYNVQVTEQQGVVPRPATRGGGLDHLGEEILLADGGGLLYALSSDASGKLQARQLPTRVPANREEFAAAFAGSTAAPTRSADYLETGAPKVQTWRFRVADVLTQTDGDDVRIFASHHYWKADEGCFVVRVSVIEASLSSLDETLKGNSWRTLFDTVPCIPLSGPGRKLGKNPFKGEEVGGRLALLDGDTLLLTLGDNGFSGTESLAAFSQDPEASYGKTIRIDLNTQASEIYTFGHRNPQGVYVAGDGRVWMTEHGSQGGDEVNLLTPQGNYGWPRVTYGTEYGAFAWPLSETQGRHDGYLQPAFAWAPSIGVSALIGVERNLFDVWRGDLIAGSLATRALYRLVIEGDRILLAEPIEIKKRVRDLLELNDGRLLVWADDGSLTTIAPAKGASGALSFGAQCMGCHTYFDGGQHRVGPDLYQIVGRPVASAPYYENYSDALKKLGGTWTPERLDAYLRDPQAAAPGTTMAFPGIKDDAERAAVVKHLGTLNGSEKKK